MKKFTILISILYLFIPDYALAGIYKCKDSKGAISFQGDPCSQNESSAKINNPMISSNNNAANKTLNLYSTPPKVAKLKPRCNTEKSSCICDDINVTVNGSDVYELIRGMERLPAYWENYNEKLKNSTSADKSNVNSSLNILGCKILLSQLLVETSYKKVASQLERSKEQRDKDSISINGVVEKNNPYGRFLSELDVAAQKIGMVKNSK